MSTQSRAAKAQHSRAELTRIAIDCFSRLGYQGTSIDLIARRAGVTKGAIYYHFRDKQDLLLATVADRVGAYENLVQKSCEGMGPADALRRVAEVSVRHVISGDHPRFTIKLIVESIDTNDRVSEQLRGMMRRFRAFMRNIIRSGQTQGVFRDDVDAEVLAASYTSAVLGAEIQYYQDPEKIRLKETVDAYIDQLITQLAPTAAAPQQGETKGA